MSLTLRQLRESPLVEEKYEETRHVPNVAEIVARTLEMEPWIADDFEQDEAFAGHVREQCAGSTTYADAIEEVDKQCRLALETRQEAIEQGQRSALGWDTRGNEIVRAAYEAKRAAEKEAARAEREAERAARLATIAETGGVSE